MSTKEFMDITTYTSVMKH